MKNTLIEKNKIYPKINIFLNVLNIKNHQTKHKIQSVFLLCNLIYDEVEVYLNNSFSVEYYEKNTSSRINYSDDISVKIEKWFKNRYKNINLNLKFKIFKNIPISSGLGGESANAAYIIDKICWLNNIRLNDDIFHDIAINLGSDICFFLTKYKIGYVFEFGNKIIEINNLYLEYELFISFNIKCKTSEIFNQFDRLQIQDEYYSLDSIKKIISNNSINLNNNLMQSVFLHNKKLKYMYMTLSSYYLDNKIILSGSGSTLVRIKKIIWK